MSEKLFELSVTDVLAILRNNPVLEQYSSQLTVIQPAFAQFLTEELAKVVDDATEVAFIRALPVIVKEQSWCNDCDSSPCQCEEEVEEEDDDDDDDQVWWDGDEAAA